MITSSLSPRPPRRFHAQPSRQYSSRTKPSSPLYLAPSPQPPLVVQNHTHIPPRPPSSTRHRPYPFPTSFSYHNLTFPPSLASPPFAPRLRPGSFLARLVLIIQSTCVMNCTDKFLKHSERVGARFAEHNAGMSLSLFLLSSLSIRIRIRIEYRILIQSRSSGQDFSYPILIA